MRAVLALLALALVVRVVAVLATDFTPVSDPADYVQHAQAIAATGSYPLSSLTDVPSPTALRPPIYPYSLGAVFALTGDSLTAGRLANAAVGTLVVGLIGLLAALWWGRRPALWAMGLAAVYPPLILPSITLLSEPTFIVFVLAAIAAAVQARRGPHRLGWSAAAGAAIGCATLTRPNGILLLAPIALLVWGGAAAGPWWGRRALAAPALAVAVGLLTITPWVVRNAVVLDHGPLLSTTTGFTFAGTFNEASRRDERFPAAWRPANADPAYREVLARTRTADEVERSAALTRQWRRFIAEHPAYPLKAAFHNLVRWLQLDGPEYARYGLASEGLPPRLADPARLAFWVVLALAALALGRGAARPVPRWVWLVPLLLALATIYAGSFMRYRVPIDVFAVLLAGWALSDLAGRAAAARRGRPAGAGGPRSPTPSGR